VVLAEDDYHTVAANVVGWTNREFFRLFDGHRVLIMGMSLDDPNLRRVLHVVQSQDARVSKLPGEAQHFAVMRALSAKDFDDSPAYEPRHIDSVSNSRIWYWAEHGVELVELPAYESILPFLMRLRYESHGSKPGDLWCEAAQICAKINPWLDVHQGFARDRLTDIIQNIRSDFSVFDRDEIVEVGIFLLKDDAKTLELVFRGGGGVRAEPGQIEFSAEPDNPTGVAGRVFVSSDLVRISRGHELYDYGLDKIERQRKHSTEYEGIISVPIIDWKHGGLPLGVIYVTTSTTYGTLFQLPAKSKPGSSTRSVDDLYQWLHTWALELLSSMM
jgi:hypothetical protein